LTFLRERILGAIRMRSDKMAFKKIRYCFWHLEMAFEKMDIALTLISEIKLSRKLRLREN